MKQQKLIQSDYKMKIIKDLGRTTANESTTSMARYAIFECCSCKKHFKARCGGNSAKNQETCKQCTLSEDQLYKHPLYAIWNGIIQRCYSEKRKDYNRYGGIGVTVHSDWKDNSELFIKWCLENGWNKELVVDKDIKSRELGISPTIYSPETISFITTQQNAEEANAKIVLQYTLDDELINEFKSNTIAALFLGKNKSSKSSIANCARGIQKTAFGFKWKYKE